MRVTKPGSSGVSQPNTFEKSEKSGTSKAKESQSSLIQGSENRTAKSIGKIKTGKPTAQLSTTEAAKIRLEHSMSALSRQTQLRDALSGKQGISNDRGLSAEDTSRVDIHHDHIYQHNQTDLEFLRLKQGRQGFEEAKFSSDNPAEPKPPIKRRKD
jgi:hypothetical protein